MKFPENLEKFLKKFYMSEQASLKSDSEKNKQVVEDALSAYRRTLNRRPVIVKQNAWGIIMKSPVTKLAVAAVIIITAVFLITFFDNAASPAYALEQTIEANHTIKTVHLRMFKGGQSVKNNEPTYYWLKYDDTGKLSNFRCNENDKDGIRLIVWNKGISKTWIPENNVVIVNNLNNTDERWENFAEEFDPKLVLQRLYDLAKEEEAIELKIDGPAEDSDYIYVKAAHSGYKKGLELVVDRKTKLIKKYSEFRLREHGDEPGMRIEFLAYNQPIDPSIFELNGIPDNVKVINQKVINQLVGLEQGNLTNEEIAATVVRETLEATIAKDYDKVSRLMEGYPGDVIEKFIEKEFEARLIRVISVGQPETRDSGELCIYVPCEIEVENEERGIWILNIIATAKVISYEDNLWVMHTHFQVSQTHMPSTGDHGDIDTPDSNKVKMLSEQSPGPIMFLKIDRRPPVEDYHRGKMTVLPTYDVNSKDAWQVDLRAYDLSALDLRSSLESLFYADFDDKTTWPSDNRMPQGFNPQRIMELGKNPGLGIRDLHSQGITGKGVGIAIIDQTLLVDQQEYRNQLRLYEEMDDITGEWLRSQMHGPAVASIAVGKTVGVAPEAYLYYIATTHGDFSYLPRCIRRILQVNEQLPMQKRIKVISISKGWSPTDDGYDEMMAVCEEAKAAGIFVVSCSLEEVYGFKFHGLGRHPLADPDVFESYESGLWWAKKFYKNVRFHDYGRLLVPMDSRTTACPTGSDKYVFYRQGGWSWSVPYIAGVYALAAQVELDITPERFWSLAMKTGRTIELEHKGQRHSFGPIIDPVALVSTLQEK